MNHLLDNWMNHHPPVRPTNCSRLKTSRLLTIVLIVCCALNVQAFSESDVVDHHHQPPHFETHEISENKNQPTASNQNDQVNNLANSKSESSVNLATSEERANSNLAVASGNSLPTAADQLNPRFELPPAQFSNSRQSSSVSVQPNALETALSGYGQVRKSPQFPTDSSSYGNEGNSNAATAAAINYQRQPQMISVLSGGASLHQR